MKTFFKKWTTPTVLAATFSAFLSNAQTTASAPDNSSINQAPQAPLLTDKSDSGTLWNDGIGSGFKKGAHEFGMNLAYAPTCHIMGTKGSHELLFGTAQVGWIVSDTVHKDSFMKGNWEIQAQGFGGGQVNDGAYLTGLDGFIRYNVSTGTRFVPFIEGGLGLMSTDIGKPDLGSNFEFNEKAGFGTHVFFSEHWAATVGVRFMHISNAGLRSPNRGVNSFPVLVGVSYFF